MLYQLNAAVQTDSNVAGKSPRMSRERPLTDNTTLVSILVSKGVSSVGLSKYISLMMRM